MQYREFIQWPVFNFVDIQPELYFQIEMDLIHSPRLKPWAMVTGCFWFRDQAKSHVKYFHVDVRQFVIWLDKSGLTRRIIFRIA